ncbi:unnamed protein product [Gulo gulo]|uniref:Uncharacterized protein n=1 Tax=Gulo gulo TaxID=48420 RepID=A0A9X9LUH9_GULGU|nr:unnamed protein product [Gulo gulo]
MGGSKSRTRPERTYGRAGQKRIATSLQPCGAPGHPVRTLTALRTPGWRGPVERVPSPREDREEMPSQPPAAPAAGAGVIPAEAEMRCPR